MRFRIALCFAVFAFAAPLGAREPDCYTVRVPVADVHGAPSTDADVVTQAIFGERSHPIARAGGWLYARTADGYEGWIDLRDLAAGPCTDAAHSVTVSSLFAAIYHEPDIEKRPPVTTLPFGAPLDVAGEVETEEGRFYAVRLPGGATAFVQSGDVATSAKVLSVEETIGLARRFLGLPYRWGGTSSFGFDCSGFTQMLMRHRGVSMPRDTRPQASWEGLEVVEREKLRPGDLLFFGKTPARINHTGMYIGGGEFIHATRRGRPSVQIGCLHDEPWTSQFVTARRAR